MLTDTGTRNAKPREKPYKLSGGGASVPAHQSFGLPLVASQIPSRRKEKLLSLGVYPEVSLKQAHDPTR
jgi:hypothetical protein